MAIEPGSGTWANHTYVANRSAVSYDEVLRDLDFERFLPYPHLLAMIGSYEESDSAHLRYNALDSDGVQLKVEEDSATAHADEEVSFLALSYDGPLTAMSVAPTPTPEPPRQP